MTRVLPVTDHQDQTQGGLRHKVTPAYSWPADRLAELLADAGLVPFARLLHDPDSERGFPDAHVLACRS